MLRRPYRNRHSTESNYTPIEMNKNRSGQWIFSTHGQLLFKPLPLHWDSGPSSLQHTGTPLPHTGSFFLARELSIEARGLCGEWTQGLRLSGLVSPWHVGS
ncbi:unnamed protein product [Rangifer tarandus platyrhynchus]|uniref:Uncharacterized protein n=1 Tax=Rangifer tarandus platyrhynchus TaxID=3082113 RepID=A0ABN8Z2T4_RANTA|nr:unnamed protein product [Rangifer tarandus platyrhynchus]